MNAVHGEEQKELELRALDVSKFMEWDSEHILFWTMSIVTVVIVVLL